MASRRVCDLRTLLAIVVGLLTTIVLGLGIWRAVVRIQRETPPPSSSTSEDYCKNGGTWENGRCHCPEDWKGLRCTIVNFCENSTDRNFTFGKIAVGRYGPSLETCGKDTLNADTPRATRLCNVTEDGEIELQNATEGNCNINLNILEDRINNSSKNSSIISTVSKEVQILTSNINNLNHENITSATKVVGQIFNSSRNAPPEAKRVAVTTVSQLLNASEEYIEAAVAKDEKAFSTLITEMEKYSWSLDNNSVVDPNIAVQSVTSDPKDTGGSTGVLFTVQKGNATSYGFIVYQNRKFFQSKTFKSQLDINKRVISSTTNNTGNNQSVSFKMAFQQQYEEKELKFYSFACVYWNFKKQDWDTEGCFKDGERGGLLHCRCDHTSNFAVLMSYKRDHEYPGLKELSTAGCALSITGLALTIIFQIVTRKVRKTSVTWVLVSLCTSMLIFNLLFVFGIENSNKNVPPKENTDAPKENTIPEGEIIKEPSNRRCTAAAALLHYFLLVMFTWTGVSAVQLYFLLIRTMKPLPQRFTLYISLIGWGVPAVVVAMTVGIIYSQNPSGWELDYRREEICWLADAKENDDKKSPLYWSFILPMTIILTSNVALFIFIMVKVVWKNNQNLTSTKKVSSLKKVFSTLSIAVIFGITWILGFFTLLSNENISKISSYLFCIFNTTQGLQIFVLYTVRTKIFQNEASKLLKSLSSSAGRVKLLPSATRMRLRVRMYNMLRSFPALNERFRLLEPIVITEEMTLSESDQASISISSGSQPS
ncbi:adhesion G-protein coupled receptor G7 isoform X2 [Myotis daubentonii]|uniref:adhesion G-protein coupled receptor G7 isoform X2 n=1 Tax=Myotis daubentonii TaxID=98922 RepID=UPI0028739A5A|nr:adhesion G-protein coupled receptor G7 isoform X2 [Myotis daubentonii]